MKKDVTWCEAHVCRVTVTWALQTLSSKGNLQNSFVIFAFPSALYMMVFFLKTPKILTRGNLIWLLMWICVFFWWKYNYHAYIYTSICICIYTPIQMYVNVCKEMLLSTVWNDRGSTVTVKRHMIFQGFEVKSVFFPTVWVEEHI